MQLIASDVKANDAWRVEEINFQAIMSNMKEQDIFSSRQGSGLLLTGQECAVHRALKNVLCARCKSTIRCGELFTRKEVERNLQLMSCLCSSCAPFRLIVDSGTSAESNLRRACEIAPDEMMRPSVEERLGPALRRGRTGRRAVRFTSR